MDEELVFWVLKNFGAKRGYILTSNEWKFFIHNSDKIMIIKYKKWQEELRRVAGMREHQTD